MAKSRRPAANAVATETAKANPQAPAQATVNTEASTETNAPAVATETAPVVTEQNNAPVVTEDAQKPAEVQAPAVIEPAKAPEVQAPIETAPAVSEVKEAPVKMRPCYGLKDHTCRIGGDVIVIHKNKEVQLTENAAAVLSQAGAVIIK